MTDPTDVEYHRRNVGLDRDVAVAVMEWHGGMGTALYSLGSIGMSDYVSPSMIDAGISELESTRDEPEVPDEDDPATEEIHELIGELESSARYTDENNALAYTGEDIDSGWATWFMDDDDDWENPATVLYEVFGDAGLASLGEDPELRAAIGRESPGVPRMQTMAVAADKLQIDGLRVQSPEALQRLQGLAEGAVVNPAVQVVKDRLLRW